MKASAPTIAVVSVLTLAGILCTIVIALTIALIVANNQRENQVQACERGNVVRASLSTIASIVQSNLVAATRADKGGGAVQTYAVNIERLVQVKRDNAYINCDAEIPRPALIP